MDGEDEVKWFRMALAMAGIEVNDRTADLVGRIYERLYTTRETYSLEDSTRIEAYIEDKYKQDGQGSGENPE